ncbi:hypothetical protein SPTER_44110 [Sporomusa termitida]|uniref:Uncharacterized protein n=2 Tax=Sporomusa termitida TaxID=2377 RepID=A0A517E031_9FIRM|nr:hypothetical protein SPTER_44110 [Sporomusa termitida]
MFINEEDFRGWLITNIDGLVKGRGLSLIVLESKNVADVILCIENTEAPIALFLELKYFTRSKNRVGIGDGIGDGFSARNPAEETAILLQVS